MAHALQQASSADTLLLFKEDHTVGEPLALTCFTANQDLDAEALNCRLWLSGEARLGLDPLVTSAAIVGVAFTSGSPGSEDPVLLLDNSASQIISVDVEDCFFYNNHGHYLAFGGSCIHAAASGNGMQLNVRRTSFLQNSSPGHGGAMFVGSDYEVLIEDCEFTGNETVPGSTHPGGALAVYAIQARTNLTITGTDFIDNRSQGPGGAICADEANLTLDDCVVSGSRSGLTGWPAGAGVFMRRIVDSPGLFTNLIATRCEFTDNIGNVLPPNFAGDGGGVLVKGFDENNRISVLVEDCSFSHNYNAQGAGIYIGRYSEGLVSRTSFRHNTAYWDGGASKKGGKFAASTGETARFEYCEFIGNRGGYDVDGQITPTNGRGGALMCRRHPRIVAINCSFSENVIGGAQTLGDAFYHFSEYTAFTDTLQLCALRNCVFYGMKGQDVQVRSDSGGFSDVSNCAWESGEFACENVIPKNTSLLTETPFYSEDDLRPHSKSQCIDLAMDLGFDQDIAGIPVPRGLGPDIGCHEYPATVDVASDLPADDFRMLTVSPNPFNPRTVISYEVVRAADLRLTVFSADGRRIKVLRDGHHQPGHHRVVWNGLDSAGRAVASGVYHALVEADDSVWSTKLTLIR
jgi:hypothetical protein